MNRRTIDARSPEAKQQRLRGASFDIDGNITSGSDVMTNNKITVPQRRTDAFQVGLPMTGGQGLRFFETNKTKPLMKPMTGPMSPRGQAETLSAMQKVVADEKAKQQSRALVDSRPRSGTGRPAILVNSPGEGGIGFERRIAGSYGRGFATNNPRQLATGNVATVEAMRKTPSLDNLTIGSGVTGIMDGYRKALEDEKKQAAPAQKLNPVADAAARKFLRIDNEPFTRPPEKPRKIAMDDAKRMTPSLDNVTIGSGVTGIGEGYRESLKKAAKMPFAPKGPEMDSRRFARF